MFVVRVADNFHYMDEEETYTHGAFATWAEAVAAAHKITDDSLAGLYRPGMKAADLYDSYVTFGDDPYIQPMPEGDLFSAWEYALQRCNEICAGGAGQGSGADPRR